MSDANDTNFKRTIDVLRKLDENLDKKNIVPGTLLITELGLDSIKLGELQMHLENEYQQEFELADLISQMSSIEEFTLKSLVDFITQQLILQE